jgi:N-acetyl-gamma-glutamyl-phosphate reductase
MHTPVVFIDGDQGTTGLQIHARLQGRGDLRLLTLPEAERKDPQRRREAINSADIALLCLPDDAAREAVAAIQQPTGAGDRRQLGAPHHARLGVWPAGLDEQQAERIAQHACQQPRLLSHRRHRLLHPLVKAGCCLRTTR